jgi:hypothetical protein
MITGRWNPLRSRHPPQVTAALALINARLWTFGIESRLLNILRSVASSARASSPLAILPPKRLRRLLRLFRTSDIFEPTDTSAACWSIRSCHKCHGLLSGANKGASTTEDASRWVMPKQTCRLVREFRVGWVLEWRPPATGSSTRRSGRLRAFTRGMLWNEFRTVSFRDVVPLGCSRSSGRPLHRRNRKLPPFAPFQAHRIRRPERAPELTGHGLPLSKCEAYNRVYDQFYQSC